jgi:hypothetical protein
LNEHIHNKNSPQEKTGLLILKQTMKGHDQPNHSLTKIKEIPIKVKSLELRNYRGVNEMFQCQGKLPYTIATPQEMQNDQCHVMGTPIYGYAQGLTPGQHSCFIQDALIFC